MTHTVAIRTVLLSSFTLLLCNSIVSAQAVAPVGIPVGIPVNVPGVIEDLPMPVIQSELPKPSPKVKSIKKSVNRSNQTKKQSSSEIKQARPGERVTNPDHEILNPDTKLGGVAINGTKPTDMGYLGPGDMRTHLWNGHSKELVANGITEYKLMAMTVPEVQKWHNYFHGVEGSPEHHDDDEHGHQETIVQPSIPPSPIYADETVYGTIVIENSMYNGFEYSQPIDGQFGIIYEPGVIIQGSTP